MALGFANIFNEVPGAKKLRLIEVSCDNNYITNGYAVTAALLGVKRIKAWVPVSTNSLTVKPVYDKANGKFKLAVTSTGLELGNGVDASAVKIYILAWVN